jgi:hypothetical protein
MAAMTRKNFQERLVRRDQDDGSFDREFWSQQGAEARFAAAWEMVAEAELFKGKDARESRLQRSVQHIQRRGG